MSVMWRYRAENGGMPHPTNAGIMKAVVRIGWRPVHKGRPVRETLSGCRFRQVQCDQAAAFQQSAGTAAQDGRSGYTRSGYG